MNITVGTMTSKGQTTVPAEVRDFLGLKPGDKIRYIRRENEIVIKAKNRRALDFAGILHDPAREALSPEALEIAIGDAVASHVVDQE